MPQHTWTIAISNARVFDGMDLLDGVHTVVIEDKCIKSIEPFEAPSPDIHHAGTVDAKGMILLPGLIDCHVHLPGIPVATDDIAGRLKTMAQCGVTTGLDMGYFPAEVRRALRAEMELVPMADFRSVGHFATCTGSTHSRFQFSKASASSNLIDDIDAAVRFVHDRLEEDVDYIKIVADTPIGPKQEVLDTITEESHKAGRLVVAHAARNEAFAMAQKAKVDIITHAPLDAALSTDDAQLMAREIRTAVPTLVMDKALSKAVVLPGTRKYPAARASVEELCRAGVTILVGTDANRSPMAPVKHGFSMWTEISLLREAGMSTVEVLRGATGEAARCFRLEDRGLIKAGYRADLMLVDATSLEAVRTVEQVKKVWVAGSEVSMR